VRAFEEKGVEDVKRLLIGTLVFALVAPLAIAAPPPPPPGTPATPAQPSGNPPVRYDWQGNHKKAQAALTAHDYPTAIKLFTDILNSGRLPKAWLAPTLYLRGKAYRSSRKYSEAIADYNAAIAADAKMDVAYYELAAIYQAQDQHAKATQAFGQAIAIKANADYYYGRCVSYSWLQKYNEAIADCERATRMKPGSANMLGVLGRLYEDSGQKQRAIETYKAALAIDPNQAEARDGLAHLSK
jgi:tetratricopeptide (TPR) repeat protein